MKRILSLVILSIITGWQFAFACEVCKKNQPEVLENITHGAGPTGTADYIIAWLAVTLVVVTLYLSIKYMVKPKETNRNHIKNIILNENA